MDKEEQYLLFALSTPMEVLNSRAIGAKPLHISPAMYTGKTHFDLSDSWGINSREELIQTIYQMTDNGHATDWSSIQRVDHVVESLFLSS
ncbi:DUF1266 domain-containing protein, partial [Salmonella enterica]|nr:DUF1266 domain-containing protein [Salmonella enterica]EJW2035528.1 DUF1266 domain-containing protein [Salmonella enterica]EJW2040059.1 DUF1266 domain-containing protein [Salmonella enterica]EJW2071231.1 DUF1266 domain-containing protein [Salmonella enterica]EJW2080270.1 DUF1266 domain-containing protein [Salmonella enterica]